MILTGDNLTNDKIQQLLTCIKNKSVKNTEINSDAQDYNWRASHYFSRQQLKKIEEFGSEISRRIVEKFNALFHASFDAQTACVTQHLPAEMNTEESKKNYYLALSGKQQFGFAEIPPQTALAWVKQFLGDNKPDTQPDRQLSQLEQSLLFDIVTSLISALAAALSEDLRPGGEMKAGLPSQVNSDSELCRITFTVKSVNSENSCSVSFWIYSSLLAKMAGKTAASQENISPQNISKALMNHLMPVDVPVSVKFADFRLNFQQVMDIQPDDIIVLDKFVNEQVDLIINRRMPLRARPASNDGKYSVVVTELCNTK